MKGMQRRTGFTESDRATHSGPVANVYAARALRDFGDGFVAVLLPVYLTALGLGAFEVGVVATLALLGSALMTLGIGFLGAKVGQRRLLLSASALMTATGLAFANADTYAVILLVAFVGTINPSSGSVSIFVPLEHALLSHAVADADRTRMFARYSLIGALAAATGSLASGSPDLLAGLGVSRLGALKGMFIAYALLGLAGGALYARIPVDPAFVGEKPSAGAWAVAWHRLQNGGSLQYRRLRRRVRRTVAHRAVAVQQVWSVAVGGGLVLLLVWPAGRASRSQSPPGFRGISAS